MSNNLKDHRQIGQEQEIFFTNDIAPGAPFWLPRGMIIFKELEKYIRELTEKAGYQETSTPIMVKSELFKQSGHWEKFGEHNMYNLQLSDEENDNQAVSYSLKPMNCPESTVIYRFRPRSYKELPLRLAEIGRLHRREKSGEVNGLLRVRQLTMDDAHIYVAEEQIFEEIGNILYMMMTFYENFGFEYEFRLATRPEKRAGTDQMWDKAENALKEALIRKGIQAGDKLGDGAFYGPKIDLHIKDSQGREWQLATVQLDFHQPEAFKLEYIDGDGQKQQPVMIHRAIFGSFERFLGILMEHFQGAFPLWLSPVQTMVIPITDKNIDYANQVFNQLKEANIRVELDDRSETMQARVRDAELQKVPYIIVVGEKEEKDHNISIRTRGQKEIRQDETESFVEQIRKNIEKRSTKLV
ncbi:threonine--tRNA ligase [Candidatus Microgenomates bacterium]|nr:threonine--tRNA ligase [Candidatus Microgenomates bacterium]